MENHVYKRLCAEPGIIRRSSIELALEILQRNNFSDLAEFLEQKLSEAPLEKPSGHKGGPESDYFRFDPEAKNYLKVSDALLSIEAIGDGFGSEFTASLLVDEWNNESRQNPRKSLGLGQRP